MLFSILCLMGNHWFCYSLIDDGKNPDEFTRDVINSCIAKNQVTKGKTDAFKVPIDFDFPVAHLCSRCLVKANRV